MKEKYLMQRAALQGALDKVLGKDNGIITYGYDVEGNLGWLLTEIDQLGLFIFFLGAEDSQALANVLSWADGREAK